MNLREALSLFHVPFNSFLNLNVSFSTLLTLSTLSTLSLSIMTIIRSAYSPKSRVSISFPDKGMTKQSFKAECDINNIMAKYQKTGLVDFVNRNQPRYGDVTGADFQAGMQAVRAGQEMFEELPSSVRKRFDNDPAAFLSFMDDPANREEAIRLGLIVPAVPPIEEVVPTGPEPPVGP